MFPNISDMFPPPGVVAAEAAEFGSTLANTVIEALDAGIELGSPFAGLTNAGAEELNKLAYDIAQAGTQGMEQLQQAITTGDVELGIATQIQTKVGAAVTGAQQALAPLKEGLQNDINAALSRWVIFLVSLVRLSIRCLV